MGSVPSLTDDKSVKYGNVVLDDEHEARSMAESRQPVMNLSFIKNFTYAFHKSAFAAKHTIMKRKDV